jgi:hypothetical protein
MPAFCPLCASDDLTSEGVTDDGRRYAVCASRDHGVDGFVWEPTPRNRPNLRSDGLGGKLDIWDKLLDCIPRDGVPRPYGDIEDRLIQSYPTEAGVLIQRYGHKWREGAPPSGHYSMSVYLSTRLRELADEKLVELTWGPAEGEWAYNGVISHWARS